MTFPPARFPRLVYIFILATVTAGCSSSTRNAEQPSASSIRVMTYNLDKDASDQRDAIRVIAESEADIVCFQEASDYWQMNLRPRLTSFYAHESFNSPTTGYDGIGIVSKFPILQRKFLPATAGGWFPAQLVVLDTPAGKLQVLGVHLRPPSTDTGNHVVGYMTTPAIRRAEIETFFQQLDPDLPTLIVGDFNEGDGRGAISFLTSHGFTDALPEFDTRTQTWRGSYGRLNISERPDHILYSSHLYCYSARVVPEQASDHDPVLAVIGAGK